MNRRLLAFVVDAGFAVALAAIAVTEIWLPLPSVEGSGDRAVSTGVAVAMCLALAFRRVAPLLVAVAMLLWPITHTITPVLVLFWGELVPLVVATYSVARGSSRRNAVLGAVVIAVCLTYVGLTVEELQGPADAVFQWLVLALAWVVGFLVGLANHRAEVARIAAIEVEVESRSRTLKAIADERARIARELHDVVAHSMSVMIVQAGAAEQVVDDDPQMARQSLATIRRTGAEALAEMRRVVAMLRDESGGLDDGAGELAPQPGTAQLATLVESARDSGLAVDFRVEGVPRLLAPGLDLAAYRIVQEALTNVRRHANARSVAVMIRYEHDCVRLEVRDDGRGMQPDSAAGHGLIGMRERAELYGGRVETSRSPGTGLTVRAVLPAGAS